MGGNGLQDARSAIGSVVLVRCAAGSYVGMGHLVRCRVLARMIRSRGLRVVMIGPSQVLRTDEDMELFDNWIERPQWDKGADEARVLLELAEQTGAAYAIVDDYRSDGEHQTFLRAGGLRCLQQYDASRPQRFAAQLIVNSSPAERAEDYADCMAFDNITMLLGPGYCILRPAFIGAVPRPATREARRILVSFGGGDDRGAVLSSLQTFVPHLPCGIEVVVMVGTQNPRRGEIAAWIEQEGGPSVRLEVSPSDVPGLLSSCDIAVLGGGTTTFEAAYCGLPMLLMPIASNQYRQGQGWEEIGAARFLGAHRQTPPKLQRDALFGLLQNPSTVSKMSRAARGAVDGNGAQRLLDALLGIRE